MKPLIFEYAETPSLENNGIPSIEYSNALNLNVIKETGKPAINQVSFDTETFTKANSDTATEGDDDYKLLLQRFIDTEFETRSASDVTESDEQNKNLLFLIAKDQ